MKTKKSCIPFGSMAKAKRKIRGYAFRNREDGDGFEAIVVDELLKTIHDTELAMLVKNSRELFRLKGEIEKQRFWQNKQYKIEK